MNIDDPYNDVKVFHKANKINQNGRVSALCYKNPRPIPATRRYIMFSTEGVTCKRCLKMLREGRG